MAREPWAWWRSLGTPLTVCAPMVDQSDRAFRLLVRRHGCDLCYTPMLHADLVVRDAAYRRDHVPDDACACVEIKFRAPHAIDAMMSP